MSDLENHDAGAAASVSESRTATTAHTPGPWTNREHSTYVWSEFGNVCACGDPHASGYVGYTHADVGSQYLNEAVANACLIAAAPDMRKALSPFAEIAGEGSEDFPDETPVVVKFGRTTYYALTLGDFRSAATAITKATGSAS